MHRDAARRLGLTLVERPVRTQDEARAAIVGIRKGERGRNLSPRLHSLNIPGFILEAGAKPTVPTMFHSPFYVERGGLASYAATATSWAVRRRGWSTRSSKVPSQRILPVEQANKFELVVNRKTARALGLTIPASVLVRATRVIDDVGISAITPG